MSYFMQFWPFLGHMNQSEAPQRYQKSTFNGLVCGVVEPVARGHQCNVRGRKAEPDTHKSGQRRLLRCWHDRRFHHFENLPMSNIIEKCIEIKITIHQEQTHKSQGEKKNHKNMVHQLTSLHQLVHHMEKVCLLMTSIIQISHYNFINGPFAMFYHTIVIFVVIMGACMCPGRRYRVLRQRISPQVYLVSMGFCISVRHTLAGLCSDQFLYVTITK